MARIVYPDDESIWLEIKPVTGRDLAAMQRREKLDPDAGMIELSSVILSGCITDWSFDEPINEETIMGRDIALLQWMIEEMNATGQRTEPQKKASNGRSAAGLRRVSTTNSLAS